MVKNMLAEKWTRNLLYCRWLYKLYFNGEKKSNEPKFCNRNRFLFCEAQQLIEWCGTIEKVSLFNKCMEGVDEIALEKIIIFQKMKL